MNKLIIPCDWNHMPIFSIKFKISPVEYRVCSDCSKLSRFSRGIEFKVQINEDLIPNV